MTGLNDLTGIKYKSAKFLALSACLGGWDLEMNML